MSRRVTGFVLLAVLVATSIALLFAALADTRDDAADATRAADLYTPPAIASGAATRGRVVLIGDDTVTSAAPKVKKSQHWAALTADKLKVQITDLATSGAGYFATGSADRSFVEQAQDVPDEADVVVLFGGANDTGHSSKAVATAAERALAEVGRRAPDARVVVVGPAILGYATPDDLLRLRKIIRAAAVAADASWVDPIRADWLDDDARSSLHGSALTLDDQRVIAKRMIAALRPLLD